MVRSPHDALGHGSSAPLAMSGVYYRRADLSNVLTFLNANYSFSFVDKSTGEPARWTVIIGENGTGKTTLLRSLSTSVEQQNASVNNVPEYLLSVSTVSHAEEYTGQKLFLEFQWESERPYHLIRKLEDGSWNWTTVQGGSSGSGHLPRLRLAAYGATRRPPRDVPVSPKRRDPIGNLLEIDQSLISPQGWLLGLDYRARTLEESRERQIAARTMEKLRHAMSNGGILPSVDDLQIRSAGPIPGSIPSVFIRKHGRWIKIEEAGLGYMTFSSFTIDYAAHLFDWYPDSEDPLSEPGICLVDELDLHMHPAWQKTVIHDLTNTFPGTQFIVTAHSPVIALAAAAAGANIIVLRREGDRIVVDQDHDAIGDWRVDQVLTSDLFGLESARSLEYDRAVRERERLHSKARKTAADRARIESLNTFIRSTPTAESSTDAKAMDLIRAFAMGLKDGDQDK